MPQKLIAPCSSLKTLANNKRITKFTRIRAHTRIAPLSAAQSCQAASSPPTQASECQAVRTSAIGAGRSCERFASKPRHSLRPMQFCSVLVLMCVCVFCIPPHKYGIVSERLASFGRPRRTRADIHHGIPGRMRRVPRMRLHHTRTIISRHSPGAFQLLCMRVAHKLCLRCLHRSLGANITHFLLWPNFGCPRVSG